MECAAKGRDNNCVPGTPKRRCGNCGAVGYCSLNHQKLHWNDHKEECARFEQQMQRADLLSNLPFSFSKVTYQGCEGQSLRCSFLASIGVHLKALWKLECSCCTVADSLDSNSRLNDGWELPCSLCPCSEPTNRLATYLGSWEDYYQWRCLPFNSPVALLLHWPLTVFYCVQLYASQRSVSSAVGKLYIHYLGPEKELLQLAVFGELRALLPCVQLNIEFFGPGVPQARDGETMKIDTYVQCSDGSCSCKSSCQERSIHTNSVVTLKLHNGFYHDKFRYMDARPQLVIAPNAGIAAYPSWLPSIKLINEMGVPAIFTDFCEEAAFLAARCICSVTGHPLSIPVNPFRQPLVMEDQALYLPCYSNCFIFGM
ncbi:zinc finger MYND domain-containing protein 15 isoform X2 [Phalaenopsis equestris]|uniref:zinc finger MYND domain-containing protein 15 isoform X2 n=1 Tax=Phalaenopsis equestris TaxID=78828 RepID=UPI0009E2BD09|nr:zinc finger MYND domain-containing protein 15 isoform X2 [Phalaenopsis equestris]